MYSHVMLGVNDMEASKQFYDATLGALGYEPGVMDKKGRCFYRTPKGVFALSAPLDGKPATGANGGTIGFLAKTTEIADAWHKAGLENGGTTCEDPPGPRGDVMYLAYLRDPAGNKICVLHKL
jgi:catechol 2,3-dioxygenase-like lactoylglutathione lyase family enzyme